ncbi:uncharacterized protein LOC110032260 [Phalaenopsis equestris]|uniref:uncharacterized protein LOC110032260 n=1 Tax=Phalaenopsis equestris TaxID=78828 RepID=UPI0009E6101C|nr:uncharacterized protein LOC110032260 [Phalaenopsis equestris]
MILGLGTAMPVRMLALNARRRRIGTPVTLASSTGGVVRVDIEQLKLQIDQLHSQAEITRSKENNARLRLMRLSEAAENLQRRAVMEVARSRENEARELLMQKKKLLLALQRTKKRLEVLDELSVKLNEAISLKETELIGNVTLFPVINNEDSAQETRIIFPKNIIENDAMTGNHDFKYTKTCEEEDIKNMKHEKSLPLYHEQLNYEEVAIDTQVSDNMSDFRTISSYEDFLEHVDGLLKQAELATCDFIRLSTIFLESKQRQMNPNLQQISDILDLVRRTRGRIASIMKKSENGDQVF